MLVGVVYNGKALMPTCPARARRLIANHCEHGLCTVGGTSKGFISLHSLTTGKRLCQNALRSDTTFKSFNNNFYQTPKLKT